MTIHLKKQKLTYFSVPKVACSSLKRVFFKIENGFSFRVFEISGRRYGIHFFAPSIALSEIPAHKMTGHVKIAALRDPWSRILSCYASKVISARALHGIEFTPEQKALGMVAEPPIDNFVDLLPHYRDASQIIRHHSEPLSYFLGTNPAFFDQLFPLNRLPEMVEYVESITGKMLNLPHASKKTASYVTLSLDETERNRKKIEDAYAEDLEGSAPTCRAQAAQACSRRRFDSSLILSSIHSR